MSNSKSIINTKISNVNHEKLKELELANKNYNFAIASFLNTRSTKRIHQFKKRYKPWDYYYILKFASNLIPKYKYQIIKTLDKIEWMDDFGNEQTNVNQEYDEIFKTIIENISKDNLKFFNTFLKWYAINKIVYGIEVDEGCILQYNEISQAITLSKGNQSDWINYMTNHIRDWWD